MKHHVSVILCIMMTLMRVSASWGQKQEPLADVGSISLAANPTDGSAMQSDSARFAAAEKEAYGRWQKHLYLKTNAVGWAFVIANIAVELDVAPHWSVALPINYSFWNYFTSKRKLRTLSVYPECRYWFDAGNRGWFVGAHMGAAYYNVAFGGKYRTQDRGGRRPALGGGISAGWRTTLSADRRWQMELSAGAGVYSLQHDKYYNRPGGLKAYTEHKTYWGFDQAAVSVCYVFDLCSGRTRP